MGKGRGCPRGGGFDTFFVSSSGAGGRQKTLNHRMIAVMSMSALLAFSLASCSDMIDELGSERRAEAAKDLGNAFVADATYYYDGAGAADAAALGGGSAPHGSHMLVEFTQPVVVSEKGLSGSVVMTWQKNKAANTDTLDISDMKAVLNTATGKCQIDMRKALEHAGTSDDGTVNMTLKLGGLVCAEGSQSGRMLPVFERKIAVAPLWTADVASIMTKSSTLGKSFVFTANGTFFSSDVMITKIEASSGTIPATKSDFSVTGVGSSSVTVKCSQNLEDSEFAGTITIGSFRPILSLESYTRAFPIAGAPNAVTLCVDKPLSGGNFNLVSSSDVLKALGDISKIVVEVAAPTSDGDHGWASIAAGGNWADATAAGCYLEKTAATDGGTKWTWTITDGAKISALVSKGLYVQAGTKATAVTVKVESVDPNAPIITGPAKILQNKTATYTAKDASGTDITSSCTFGVYSDARCTTACTASDKVSISNNVVTAAADAVKGNKVYVRAEKGGVKSNVVEVTVVDKATLEVANDVATLGAVAGGVTSGTTSVATVDFTDTSKIVITAVAQGTSTITCTLTGATSLTFTVTVNADATDITAGTITKWVTSEKTVNKDGLNFDGSAITAIATSSDMPTGALVGVKVDVTATGGTKPDNWWGGIQETNGTTNSAWMDLTGNGESYSTGSITDPAKLALYKTNGIYIKAAAITGATAISATVTLTYVP